jgi:bifunctional non-homologous end joining protein LigD
VTKLRFPQRATAALLPKRIKLQVCSFRPGPPAGDAWLHELKHDGHRLVAVLDSRGMRLISRNGYNRTELFQAPFERLAGLGREMVLDGEIAVPDKRGVIHIGDLQDDAVTRHESWRLAYFASFMSKAMTCAAARSRSGRCCSSACRRKRRARASSTPRTSSARAIG